MTHADIEAKLDEIYKQHGPDYVVTADNHPEILRALNDLAVAEFEAERAAIVAGEQSAGVRDE